MADIQLAAPRDIGDLYLGPRGEVPLARPVLTGDVFRGVELDIDDDVELIIVVAHPCSMRGGFGRLNRRITVAPVRIYQPVPFERWPGGHYNVIPLPELLGHGQEVSHAADFRELASARSGSLDRAQRVAALCNRGIHLLQQRFVYSFTRVVVGLEKLEQQAAHVLLEAELEEEWVDELAEDDDNSRANASEAFAGYLNDQDLRIGLLDPVRRSDVARSIRAEIQRRCDVDADPDLRAGQAQ